jgi:hypothetical protein
MEPTQKIQKIITQYGHSIKMNQPTKQLLRHFRPRTSSSREGRGSGGGIN